VLYAVHLLPPIAAGYGEHRAEFADLMHRLMAEGPATIVAEDFNFVDRGLTATRAWLGAPTGSDHLPLGAAITLTDG